MWHDHEARLGAPERKRRVLVVLSHTALRLQPASPPSSPSGRRQSGAPP